MSQYYRQSFSCCTQTTERAFSPPAITIQRDQSNTTFQSQHNNTATTPSSFQFFNMQNNPIISQLHDIFAEECQNTSLPSTLIQTVTQDYNNNGYRVSCEQKLQIWRNYPTLQSNYTACWATEFLASRNSRFGETTQHCSPTTQPVLRFCQTIRLLSTIPRVLQYPMVDLHQIVCPLY
jgi:hypothetical protein